MSDLDRSTSPAPEAPRPLLEGRHQGAVCEHAKDSADQALGLAGTNSSQGQAARPEREADANASVNAVTELWSPSPGARRGIEWNDGGAA